MMDFGYKSNVLLPERFWEEATSNEHFKQLVSEYMRKCYPDYRVVKVKDGMAVCTKK